MYFIFDQTLWKPSPSSNDTRGLRGFFEYGQTDAAVAPIYRHYGAGVTWTGLLPRRPNDIAGFGPEYVLFSPQRQLPHDHELALEVFYKAQLTHYAAFQPDLQYIEYPSGMYPSAFVATMRLQLLF